MTKPELFEVIELLVDLPEHNLRPGVRGAIVHCHPDGTYEVEFTNEDGETVALCPLSADQFIVVWQARTRTWLPISGQIAALVAHLPEDTGREVLDFARFLRERRQQQAESTAHLATMAGEASS
jgi:hypothetical protein